jgi:hypothetical protein
LRIRNVVASYRKFSTSIKHDVLSNCA